MDTYRRKKPRKISLKKYSNDVADGPLVLLNACFGRLENIVFALGFTLM